jgi:EpsI family protein
VRWRLAALVLALLLPALILGRWMLASSAEVMAVEPLLPRGVDQWTASRQETLDPKVLKLIEPDAYSMRLYEAEGAAPVWVYVGLYAGHSRTGRSAHVPEACYPAQGWEILGSEKVSLELPGGERLVARKLDAHKGVAREAVLYWFQPAGRWPATGGVEQLLHVLDAVRGQPQYAFVRISVDTEADPSAERDLEAFAAQIAPEIRRAVESLRRQV